MPGPLADGTLPRGFGFRRISLYTNAVMRENLAWYPRLGYRVSRRLLENGYDRVYFVKEL